MWALCLWLTSDAWDRVKARASLKFRGERMTAAQRSASGWAPARTCPGQARCLLRVWPQARAPTECSLEADQTLIATKGASCIGPGGQGGSAEWLRHLVTAGCALCHLISGPRSRGQVCILAQLPLPCPWQGLSLGVTRTRYASLSNGGKCSWSDPTLETRPLTSPFQGMPPCNPIPS